VEKETRRDNRRKRIGRAEFLLGGGMLTKFGKLFKALQAAYPENAWDERKFSSRRKKVSQR
jgi:hypothetical protein